MNNSTKEKLKDIFFSAIDAVNPYNIVIRYGKLLKKDPFVTNHARLYAVSFGKAAYAMSRALEDTLGTSIQKGIAIVPDDLHGQTPLKQFDLYLANHPIPDERGTRATQKIIELLQSTDEETLVIFLISGGGSALLIAPNGPVDLEDKRTVTEILLKAGATIGQINTIRKHISAVKGGRLAEAAYPARTISLILSDVPGDNLDIIASGPTAPDSSTYSQALAVIRDLDLLKETPVTVMKILTDGKPVFSRNTETT
jgi:hydroxypyruvate reductase/glycerate 2-kinase